MNGPKAAAMSRTLPGGTTAALASRSRAPRWDALTSDAATVAKQCLLDWLGVSLAARQEPLVRILADELAPVDDPGGCTLIGLDRRARIDTAVLINGAMSHALDFDDVLLGMGHPTAPVAPVVLALAEQRGATGAEAILALVAGVEAECRVGALMGPSHYAAGWHSTGTYGTFGAAMAAATLLGLDDEQLLHCFGLAGTQAAGLKSVFGTMSKPLHPGKSAQNGLLAARLAGRGFTSDTDILGSAQGFADTQSTTVNVAAALADFPAPHIVNALFKYHASCYLTHNAIEAANQLRASEAILPGDIESVTVEVQAMHMGVCSIEEPATGLECKFSLRMTTALALAAEDTFDDALFSDETARRPDLIELRRRIKVEPISNGPASTVHVRLKNGSTLSRTANVATPVRNLARQQAMLESKFRHLATAALGSDRVERVIGICRQLEQEPDVSALLTLCRSGR
jgi:2-methylcitrate dehydratase PrpD